MHNNHQQHVRRTQADSNVRRADFLSRPRFSNTLPDMPFEGKFMGCPFVPLDRFVNYTTSSLEKEYKRDVLCDDDMGIQINLVDFDKYTVRENEPEEQDDRDKMLLDDDLAKAINHKRSAQHSRLVPWMRKTEYISTEFNRLGVAADRQETKLGYNLKKNNHDAGEMYRDHQSQIDAITKTFEDVKKPIKAHYSKKGVTPLEELPIFPDFENWKWSFAQATFDGDTAPSTQVSPEMRRFSLENSLLRGLQDNSMTQFAVHYSPSVETLQKILEDREAGIPYTEDHVYEMIMNREYEWKVESRAANENENLAITFKNGAVAYSEIGMLIRLNRRRKSALNKKSTVLLRFRDPNDRELALREQRQFNFLQSQKSNKDEMNGDREEQEQEDEEEGGEEEETREAAESDAEEAASDRDSDDSEPRNKRKRSNDSDDSGSKDASSDESDGSWSTQNWENRAACLFALAADRSQHVRVCSERVCSWLPDRSFRNPQLTALAVGQALLSAMRHHKTYSVQSPPFHVQ
ncbi:unnamed protein product [Caenorhabditis auriculariae]|uniref:RNA polymerase II-associated factor 1 homolog n=1 Tax=Caenorhabditis auriculariae TaxID=2777116 RepID=A0A8S1HCK2_9PELO|nr:unnamed protein product [Caenorhabditis auriculariae]